MEVTTAQRYASGGPGKGLYAENLPLAFRATVERLGDDPATFFLEEAKVALNQGPRFGDAGNGFARLNFACSTAVLTEAVRRMGAACGR